MNNGIVWALCGPKNTPDAPRTRHQVCSNESRSAKCHHSFHCRLLKTGQYICFRAQSVQLHIPCSQCSFSAFPPAPDFCVIIVHPDSGFIITFGGGCWKITSNRYMVPIVPERVQWVRKFCIPGRLRCRRLREERICPGRWNIRVGRRPKLLCDDCLNLLESGPEFLLRHEASCHEVYQLSLVPVEPGFSRVEQRPAVCPAFLI